MEPKKEFDIQEFLKQQAKDIHEAYKAGMDSKATYHESNETEAKYHDNHPEEHNFQLKQ